MVMLSPTANDSLGKPPRLKVLNAPNSTSHSTVEPSSSAHVDQESRVGIAPHDLGQHPLDDDFPGRIEIHRHRMVVHERRVQRQDRQRAY